MNMVKGNNNETTREPIKTIKTSAQERRNSVSDIKDYFQAKCESTPMANRKASGKKDKEREKELKETRENIKALIFQDKTSANNTTNANGAESMERDKQDKDSHAHDKAHDNGNDGNPSTEESNKTKAKASVATQTSEDEMLSAIQELVDKYNKLEERLEQPKDGIAAQLAKTQATVTTLYSDINGAVSGLKVQMKKITEVAAKNTTEIEKMQDSQKRMAALLDENKRIIAELKVMQGLVQKVSTQTSINTNQILDATKRGMEQNLVLHGVDNKLEISDSREETPLFTYKERCKHSALSFFTDVMNLDIDIHDIWKAHRVGAIRQDRVRPLVVKISYEAKDLIMENVTKLKGLSNPKTKQKYFVSEQIPEGILETKKQVFNRAKYLKDKNEAKPKAERSTIQVVNDKILVDGEIEVPEVSTPQPSQLFLDSKSQQEIDAFQSRLKETEPLIEKSSEFMAFAAKARSIEEVNKLYVAIAQRYPAADHIMMAYALKEGETLKTGFCDDREYGAGVRIKKLIFEHQCRDTFNFCS